ncbi:hypothetical protein MKW94_017314 [Papaver nudicaule]|uniref:Uncharacterized protein n=1 Tax=Papaver nudicaule TaxID=74823 RepID=A0AA42ARA7_PAPNU|nr:hypothetical protein [Papaver nudicaule]
MEIPEKLLKLKYYIIFSTLMSVLFLSLVLLAPRFLTIVSYFWPLFVSTALFLFTVVFFAKVSPLSTSGGGTENESLSCAEKAGEGLLDYVAGQTPQVLLDTIDDEDEEDSEDEMGESGQPPLELDDDQQSTEKSNHNKMAESVAAQASEVHLN